MATEFDNLGEALVTSATAKAVRVKLKDMDEELHWFPRSVCDPAQINSIRLHDTGHLFKDFRVATWFMDKMDKGELNPNPPPKKETTSA